MTREEYPHGEPRAFARWLGTRLQRSPQVHSYFLPNGTERRFASLEDALAGYEWPFSLQLPEDAARTRRSTYAESEAVLARIGNELTSALHDQNGARQREPTLEWATRVLEWGGVAARNRRWLHEHSAHLAEELLATAKLLAEGDDAQLRPPKKGSKAAAIRRFNAGMTKIYALLVPNFVIYDSRVAAALGWFVARWCEERKLNAVPDCLGFRWMPARKTPSETRPKQRNPGSGNLRFKRMGRSAYAYAYWNLRASWVLHEALRDSNGTVFHRTSSPLRALEAALFMVGYDLDSTRRHV